MNIDGKITGIQYKITLPQKLVVFELDDFNINEMPSSFILNYGISNYGISKWVSPKRTRSYPYERVYNTLSCSKRITIIPIVKDEGINGDRDYLQWDTISLMSLLDVFVIFTYYESAEINLRRKNKITNQRFNNEYILTKINEIRNYHSSALHWNLKEISDTLPVLINNVKDCYQRISKNLNIAFHSVEGLNKFEKQFFNGVNEFMYTSRHKAKEAQMRELKTIQPKELLKTNSKATITIENYLGGKYFLTADEVKINKSNINIIESKHSKNSILPSIGDIKDGLIKMILFTNLKEITVSNKRFNHIPTLQLTSASLKGKINTNSSPKALSVFFSENNMNNSQQDLIFALLKESRTNGFILTISSIHT